MRIRVDLPRGWKEGHPCPLGLLAMEEAQRYGKASHYLQQSFDDDGHESNAEKRAAKFTDWQPVICPPRLG